MADVQDDFGDTVQLEEPITPSAISELAKVNALRPSIKDFADKPGYYVEENGTAHYPFVMNRGDGTGPTKEAQEFAEHLRAFNRASADYQQATQAKIVRETLIDQRGQRHQVEPHMAERTAKMNGWHADTRSRGARVERGSDNGMLWRLLGGRWMPTGLRCLGTPLSGEREYPCRGLVHDPSGQPWRGCASGWIYMGEE